MTFFSHHNLKLLLHITIPLLSPAVHCLSTNNMIVVPKEKNPGKGRNGDGRIVINVHNKRNSCFALFIISSICVGNDETQRYQLCHYDVVVAQLVALGFIKRVAAGSKPAYRLRNTCPSFSTVYSTVPVPGDWIRSLNRTMRLSHLHVGGA